MHEVKRLMEMHSDWRLAKRDPLEGVDLRLLGPAELDEFCRHLEAMSVDRLATRLDEVEQALSQRFRRGGAVDKIMLSNLVIMREQITKLIMKKKFGEGWQYPENSLPEEELDEARETFKAAAARIMDHLEKEGWKVQRHLKIPRADAPGHAYMDAVTLWFKKQAIYYATSHPGMKPDFKSARSIHVDIRGMDAEKFMRYLDRWVKESVDLPVDRAELVAPEDELSVWEKYGMKQTPGWAPPSWALDKKDLSEK